MPEFRVTYGGKYRSPEYGGEAHPVGGHQFVHPDGYWTIVAPDYIEARSLITALLGTRWSNLYDGTEGWTADWPDLFPRGELLRIIHPQVVPS